MYVWYTDLKGYLRPMLDVGFIEGLKIIIQLYMSCHALHCVKNAVRVSRRT